MGTMAAASIAIITIVTIKPTKRLPRCLTILDLILNFLRNAENTAIVIMNETKNTKRIANGAYIRQNAKQQLAQEDIVPSTSQAAYCESYPPPPVHVYSTVLQTIFPH